MLNLSPGASLRAALLTCVLTAVVIPVDEVKAEEESGGFLGLDWKGSLGEGRHTRYVPPITNPILNETPYITTESRAFYFYHEIPGGFVSDGGHVNLWALQLRVALTERLAFIATKDGYADIYFDEVLEDDDGFANLAFGFKYAVYSDPEEEDIATVGLRYEVPIGDLDSSGIELAGNGDGFLNPFVTGAMAFGDFGLQASFGANFALNQDQDTSIVHYSLHGDYELFDNFFPMIEFNGFTAIDRGNRLKDPLDELDGLDLLNFGSEGRDTSATFGGGFRYQFLDNFKLGAGAETPITGDSNDTIMDYRVYFDLIYHL